MELARLEVALDICREVALERCREQARLVICLVQEAGRFVKEALRFVQALGCSELDVLFTKLLGKFPGDAQMWKECKVDFQNANSVQMNNLRTNANAIAFLASGRWRRWTKDLPPGAGSMGRVDAANLDAKLEKEGKESLLMYNELFQHFLTEVLIKFCIGFSVLSYPVHWKDSKDATKIGVLPFYCVFGSTADDTEIEGVVLFKSKTIQYMDFLMANALWYNQGKTESAMDSVTGTDCDHDGKTAMTELCKVLKSTFTALPQACYVGTPSGAPKRSKLMMDLSDSEEI